MDSARINGVLLPRILSAAGKLHNNRKHRKAFIVGVLWLAWLDKHGYMDMFNGYFRE